MTRPLEGLMVADFSRVLAGPLAAATLADLGAEVIKVERPGSGDDTRHWGPPWTATPDGTSSSYFESANRSKKSVELDLADPADLAIAQELARRCDILIENFKTGSLERYDLGYDAVSSRNPGVIYASISGFGSKEGADLAGYDFLVQAVGGLMSITGRPDEPTKAGVALVDVLTSKDAIAGILAALRVRDVIGHGQHVEVNLLSSLLGSLANQASGYLTTGTVPVAMGNQHPSIAPYETLRAEDGHVAVCCGNDNQFTRLAIAVGRPELSEDPRFARNGDRVAHREALVGQLEEVLATDTVDSWVERLSRVGLPVGKVGTVADGFELAARLGLEPTVDVGEGRSRQVRSPLTFSATPVTAYTAPPALGEHNDVVRTMLSTQENPR
ncbi:CaiB/BaiF CoA transferase family protein [Nocardioides sp. YIM B13467]|uniref:CaiB/BaiF CoA transferase family protein n=1 Tax=Nocardioides sp. YIM B13467 TaxID=3366294 RepID=UPI003671D9CE